MSRNQPPQMDLNTSQNESVHFPALYSPRPQLPVSHSPAVKVEMSAGTLRSSPSSPNLPIDNSFLSPPEHTFRSRPSRKAPRRPASAPPIRTTFDFEEQGSKGSLTPISHSFKQDRTSSFSGGVGAGDLLRPPPPLFRPTTFWKNTRRSGVTGASYSPSSHLIRRSTFIAAGLTLDSPVADLSAFGVESRIGVVYLPPDTSL
ncbi:hypothetical protein C8Q75DRAFT_802928 [Abortiporus biennis]|nr:hypothetical protein C8Q75DRAFT_802928 [Abortiporus biennis]